MEETLSTADFLMGLSPEQKQTLMSAAEEILQTLMGYLGEYGATALDSENVCISTQELGSFYGIAGSPQMILAMHKLGKVKIKYSLYLNTLGTFSEARAAPQDRKALGALAFECAVFLYTGRNDLIDQPRDLPESPFDNL